MPVKPATMNMAEMKNVLRARNNGSRYSEQDAQAIQASLAGMPNGTQLVASFGRGTTLNWEKLDDNSWKETDKRGNTNTRTTKQIASEFTGTKGFPPSAVSIDIKQPAAGSVSKGSSSGGSSSKGSIPAFVRNSKNSGTVVTMTGNRMFLDLASSDATASHVKQLEKAGWKRRGKSNTTWVK